MTPEPAAASSAALAVEKLTVRYGPLLANDGVDFAVHYGEVHAVLGENGAGKSTLMNVLAGLQQPDEGRLLRNGKPVRLKSPRKAARLGIGMIHQHEMLVDRLTVVENIVLGGQRGLRRLDLSEAADRLTQLGRQTGLAVEPWEYVEHLSPGARQRVEILKLLWRDARVLILDEPTSVLAPPEVEPFLDVIANLARAGRAVVLITHKLDEALRVADRITVMRGGRVVACRPGGASTMELARLMVDRPLATALPRGAQPPGMPVIEANGITVRDRRRRRLVLENIDLAVRAGEIVGIAGVDGNGQTELAEVIAGLRPFQAGSLRLIQFLRVSGVTPTAAHVSAELTCGRK